jgi:hypothetical protein
LRLRVPSLTMTPFLWWFGVRHVVNRTPDRV